MESTDFETSASQRCNLRKRRRKYEARGTTKGTPATQPSSTIPHAGKSTSNDEAVKQMSEAGEDDWDSENSSEVES